MVPRTCVAEVVFQRGHGCRPPPMAHERCKERIHHRFTRVYCMAFSAAHSLYNGIYRRQPLRQCRFLGGAILAEKHAP